MAQRPVGLREKIQQNLSISGKGATMIAVFQNSLLLGPFYKCQVSYYLFLQVCVRHDSNLALNLENICILISIHTSYELEVQKPWFSPNFGPQTSSAPKVQGEKPGLSKSQNRWRFHSGPSGFIVDQLGVCEACPTRSDFEGPDSPAQGDHGVGDLSCREDSRKVSRTIVPVLDLKSQG